MMKGAGAILLQSNAMRCLDLMADGTIGRKMRASGRSITGGGFRTPKGDLLYFSDGVLEGATHPSPRHPAGCSPVIHL